MPLVPDRLPRALHPGAWWLWALGMATAASRTTNPLLLGLTLAVVGYVVSARRTDAPWAKGFRAYLVLGLVIIAIRVLFRMVLDGQYGEHVLFTLPEVPLPDAAAGIRLGGPVSLEGLLAAFYDGLRLATLLICLGAANVLANPKRLLKSVPGALHEVGVAVTVALTVAPQLVESGQRVYRARRLRGEVGRRTRVFRAIVIPVMTDALDRSLLLAAAMDARGYGRVQHVPRRTRTLTGTLVLVGLVGVCIGTYGLLDGSTSWTLGAPMLGFGLTAAGAGFLIGGQRVRRTRYRPDPWSWAEWGVTASGVAVAAGMFALARVDPADLNPSLQPLTWPPLPLAPTLVILVGILPAFIAPPPPRTPTGAPSVRLDPHPEPVPAR
ncbi:MAG: energy-coupling factor transporter transmembrane component T family protein [Microthrixaceae bacterium]